MSTISNFGASLAVLSGVGAGVYGAYVQMIASTTIVGKWLWFIMDDRFGNGVQNDVEISIATGAGGSEVDDYSDIYFWNPGNVTRNNAPYNMPIEIPSGSRIAIRIKDDNAAAIQYDPTIVITDISMPLGAPVGYELLSPVTMVTLGLAVEGVWVQLSASLARKADYMITYVEQTSSIDTIAYFDIGQGAGGSEVIQLNELQVAIRPAGIRMTSSMMWNGPISFDNGQRIAVRCRDIVPGNFNYRCGMGLIGY